MNQPFRDFYWAIKDKLLAGEYPGDTDENVAQARVNALIKMVHRLTESRVSGSGGDREIEVPGPKAKFSELLRLTAEAHGMAERGAGSTRAPTTMGKGEVNVGVRCKGVGKGECQGHRAPFALRCQIRCQA